MPKPLRRATPIPIQVEEELWITQDKEGAWLLSRPLVVNMDTGKGMPGAIKGPVRVLHPGDNIAIILG